MGVNQNAEKLLFTDLVNTKQGYRERESATKRTTYLSCNPQDTQPSEHLQGDQILFLQLSSAIWRLLSIIKFIEREHALVFR